MFKPWSPDPNVKERILIAPTTHRSYHRDIVTPQILRELSARRPIRTLADIGCGSARLRKLVEPEIQYLGFDLFPQADDVHQWDIERQRCPIVQEFDCVVLHDVIEHLGSPLCALQNVSDCLGPEGYLIITTPNIYWSRSRLYLLIRGEPSEFQLEDLLINHHVFPTTPYILQYFLIRSGFEILEYATLDDHPPLDLWEEGLRFPLRVFLRFIYRALESYDERAIGRSYCIVAQKSMPAN